MNWFVTTATDAYARVLADRHYPRENVGAKFFTPPGRKLVLRTLDGSAFWVSLFQQYSDHAWAGAWQCSAFRNETSLRSSDLIIEALAATVARWGWPPPEGLITFVDPKATEGRRSKRHLPGHCFRVAGFEEQPERTTRGYLCLRLAPERFPAPVGARSLQLSLEAA